MSLLKVGDPSPDFSLQDQSGHVHTQQPDGVTVLYFYPKDDTPGCTREACDFQSAISRLAGGRARVLGVSPDPVESHQRFAEKFKLGFPLLADVDRRVCSAYGVLVEKTGKDGRTFMGIERTTYVLEGGKVRAVFPKVQVDGHVEQVVSSLA